MSFFQKSIRSDEDLLTSLRQGSEDAFTVIYERYHKLLYVLAYKYLKSTYSSEDAVQQVFLKLWEARSLLMEREFKELSLYNAKESRIK